MSKNVSPQKVMAQPAFWTKWTKWTRWTNMPHAAYSSISSISSIKACSAILANVIVDFPGVWRLRRKSGEIYNNVFFMMGSIVSAHKVEVNRERARARARARIPQYVVI